MVYDSHRYWMLAVPVCKDVRCLKSVVVIAVDCVFPLSFITSSTCYFPQFSFYSYLFHS